MMWLHCTLEWIGNVFVPTLTEALVHRFTLAQTCGHLLDGCIYDFASRVC